MFLRIFIEMKIWKGNIYFLCDENFGGKDEQRSYQRKRTEKISSADQNTDPRSQSGCEKISPRFQKQSGGIHRRISLSLIHISDDEEERKPGRKPKKAAKAAESAKPTSEPEAPEISTEVMMPAAAAEKPPTAAEPVTTTSAAEPDITEPAATENAEPEPEKNEKTAEKTEHQNTETQES